MYFIEGSDSNRGQKYFSGGQIIKGSDFFIGRGQNYFIKESNFNSGQKYYKEGSNFEFHRKLNYEDLLSLSKDLDTF